MRSRQRRLRRSQIPPRNSPAAQRSKQITRCRVKTAQRGSVPICRHPTIRLKPARLPILIRFVMARCPTPRKLGPLPIPRHNLFPSGRHEGQNLRQTASSRPRPPSRLGGPIASQFPARRRVARIRCLSKSRNSAMRPFQSRGLRRGLRLTRFHPQRRGFQTPARGQPRWPETFRFPAACQWLAYRGPKCGRPSKAPHPNRLLQKTWLSPPSIRFSKLPAGDGPSRDWR